MVFSLGPIWLICVIYLFIEDYLPHGNECENNPYKRDYNPCKEGWYCADDDLCNSGGLDCCKPKLQLDDICDDHKDCQDGLYCADKRDVGGRYDLCRPVPKKYSHLTICDKDYHLVTTVQTNKSFATNETVPENSMLIVVEVKKFNPNKTWKKVQAKTQIKLKQQIQLLVKLKNTTLKYQ